MSDEELGSFHRSSYVGSGVLFYQLSEFNISFSLKGLYLIGQDILKQV